MKKVLIYSLFAGSITCLSGCSAKLQTYDLSEEYATSLHYQPAENPDEEEEEGESSGLVGIPARHHYGGDLKRGAIWWTGKGMTLEKGDVFVITATEVGPDSSAFGATFPPIDLVVEEVAIKVTMRAEGKDGAVPVIYMQVDDADGYQANAKRPYYKVENSEGFQEYYFSTKDIFLQSLPKKHKVNGALINSLKFFINPGQTAYSGKIFIKEVKVVPVSAVPK